MDKKIIVAGGGHGGIVAAALLSQKGYDVTVYEKCTRRKIGYDWTDVFQINCFDDAGIPRPPENTYEKSHPITYTNPHKNVFINMPDTELSTNSIMDRKILIKYLISYAEKCGVKFKFGYEIIAPVCDKSRVLGIVVKKFGRLSTVFASLVIDSAGMNSPVRTLLPERFNIQHEMGERQIFTAYRAFYKKIPGNEPKNKYLVHFYHMREPGLDWVISEKGYMDVLIGRFSETLSQEQIEAAVTDLKGDYPSIGDKIIRGGQIAQIPVRRTLPILVSDGYAAIGDCAAMTIPVVGSGIANSIRAGKYLADAVLADENREFTAKTLWKYQYDYFTNVGNGLVLVDKLRDLATSLSADDVDYLLEKEILSVNEFALNKNKAADIQLSDIMQKLVRALPKFPVLANAAKTFVKLGTVKRLLGKMPKEYDENEVKDWAQKYRDV